MVASHGGHSEVVQLLLAAHANVNAQDQVRLEIYIAMCILYHYSSSVRMLGSEEWLAILASRDASLLSAGVPGEYLYC